MMPFCVFRQSKLCQYLKSLLFIWIFHADQQLIHNTLGKELMIDVLHDHIALFQAFFIQKGHISITHHSCFFNPAKTPPKGAFSCPIVSNNGYDFILGNAEIFKLQALFLPFIGETEFFKTQRLFTRRTRRFRLQAADVRCSKSKGTELFRILLS